MTGYASRVAADSLCNLNNSTVFPLPLPQSPEETQVDQNVDERVAIRNRRATAKMRTFNAQSDGLRIDSLNGSVLMVNLLIAHTVPIQSVAQARADARRHLGCTSTALPMAMPHRTMALRLGWKTERTHALAARVFDDALGAIGEREFQRHRETGWAEWQTVRIELALLGFVVAFLPKRHSGKATLRVGLIFTVKIGAHIPRVERRIESRVARTIASAVRFAPSIGAQLNIFALVW